MKNYKIECLDAFINVTRQEHILILKETPQNAGIFGSKIKHAQFEKIESVLSKKYIKLPFGIRIIF